MTKNLLKLDLPKLLRLYYRDKSGEPIKCKIVDKRRRNNAYSLDDIISNGKKPTLEEVLSWNRHYKQYNRHFKRIKQLKREDIKLNTLYLKAMRNKDKALKNHVYKRGVKVDVELQSLIAKGYKDTHYEDFRSRN